MKRMMVRYRIKADRVDENKRYIRNVFEQLKHEQPIGLRYATFVLDDGLSFMHLVSLETEDGSNPLHTVAAFKAFTAGIQDRCDELPVAVDLQEVGSYAWFGE